LEVVEVVEVDLVVQILFMQVLVVVVVVREV
jgi:hypothetical protein